jgi:hypothetical protein
MKVNVTVAALGESVAGRRGSRIFPYAMIGAQER